MLIRKSKFAFLTLATLAALATAAPGCAGALGKAQDALTVGDEAEAEVQLRKALKSNSTKAEASKLLSVLLAQQGNEMASADPRGAENRYLEALELDSRNEEARLGLARLYMKRGFMDDANELLAMEGCHGCGRLKALMIHESAEKALQAGEIETARALFQEAFEVGGDALDALGLVHTYLAVEPPDLPNAVASLDAAAPMIARGSVDAEQAFQAMRTKLLLSAAAARENAIVEQVFGIRTEALKDEPEFELRFRVSQEQFRKGDSTPAIERLSSLLVNSGQYLDPTQRQVMEAALVVMYSARAAQNLRVDDAKGAAMDIAAGLKLEPDNTRLQLQQVLAIASGRLPLAFTKLDEVRKSKDKNQVSAILWSLQALADLDEGKLKTAEESLDKAEGFADGIPEVALARAYVMAEQRNDDLKKAELKDARKLDPIEYPNGRINRYPRALAELAHALALIDAQGPLHAWRGAGFDQRVEALKQKLAFYPYEVRWHDGKGGLIEIVAASEQKSVEYSGPRWLKGTALASPEHSAEIPVPNVGLVKLTVDGKEVGVIVEDHAHIEIRL